MTEPITEAEAKAEAIRIALRAIAVEHDVLIVAAFSFGSFFDQDGDKSSLAGGFIHQPQQGSHINDMIGVATKLCTIQKELEPFAAMGKVLGKS